MPETNQKNRNAIATRAGYRRFSGFETKIAVTKSVTPAPGQGVSRTDEGG